VSLDNPAGINPATTAQMPARRAPVADEFSREFQGALL
jgi:hypothetical protein